MNVTVTGPNITAASRRVETARNDTPQQAQAVETDSVSLDSNRNERVLGNIGAGVGAILGRFAAVGAAGAAGAALGGLLGPVGAVLGGIAGVAGGMLGGTMGSLAGKVVDRLPGDIRLGSERLNQESRDFSLPKLARNLDNVGHTSHPTMDQKGATKEILDLLKPGDVIMTNNDVWMDFEIPLLLTGNKGDWTHTALYVGDGNLVESLGSRGVIKRPARELIGENHHVKILRPEYPEGGLEKTIADAESHIGQPYDNKFSLQSDDALYCIEHTQKALKAGNPAVDLEPTSLAKWKVVTPETFNRSRDLEVVYDTGSHFTSNYLSKFS